MVPFVCVCWRGRAAVARGVRREGGLNLTATGLISAWQVVSLSPPYALPSQPQTSSRTHTAAPSQSVRTRSSSSSPALPVISDHLDCMTGQLRTRQERKGTLSEGKESAANTHAEDKASAEPVALQRHSSTGGWSVAARGKTGAGLLRGCVCRENICLFNAKGGIFVFASPV